MKIKVLCLDYIDPEVEVRDEYELDEDGWEGFYYLIEHGCLDDIKINYEDIDKSVFVTSDGGDLFRLKDGRWMNICCRGLSCHIWEERDSETLEIISGRLSKC